MDSHAQLSQRAREGKKRAPPSPVRRAAAPLLAMTTEPVAPPHEEKEKEASSDPCSNACAAMGLDHVLKTVQKVWTDVSHTGFLGCGHARAPKNRLLPW